MGSPTQGDVRAFLGRVRGAPQWYRGAPGGVGQIMTVSGNGIGGESLEYESRCVHAGLFPQLLRPIPMPVPMPRPMPER